MPSEATQASSELVRPASIERLAEMLAATQADGRTVGLRGAGTKQNGGGAGLPTDVTISTRGIDRIVEHAAGDLVVTVEAGALLTDVQRVVGKAGQWLALDPPESGATIGGVVATAASGPRRLRYGTPRDLLIGSTVVLADGTVAKAGGKVVKNVAGYDLGRLFTGSYGTLGVIAECTFRLHPRPVARRVVVTPTDDPYGCFSTLRATGVEPVAAEWDGTTLTTVFESTESAVSEQADLAIAAVGGTAGSSTPSSFGQRAWADGRIGLKITHRIGKLPAALAAVNVLPAAQVRCYVGCGVIEASVDAEGLASLASLRSAVSALDGQVVVASAPDDVRRDVDVWGPVRGLTVMQRIKDQFDPDGRMCPGRFVVTP
ncbi:MAG TPA: FAD-binding oxidoreductase [Mycobacteriales bacterium]|jgi:glycolate oxidase FAD binding subunit|nr:FAD-binding oxidoreductase [Mycobacteriales bacterium]